jgi:hypothetical protein
MRKKNLSVVQNWTASFLLAIVFTLSGPAVAQYSDLDLGLKPAEKDSLLKNYDNIFPIYGRKVLEKGIRLPAPLGININYFAATQNVLISNLALGINDLGPVNMSDVILFEESISNVDNWNARIDLWVLPFLNVYGIGGYSRASTTVTLSSPIRFETTAEMEGPTYGAGFTMAGGLQGFWIAFDANWSWSDLDIMEDPIGSTVIGLRVGKNYRWRDKSVALWVGAMKVSLESGTEGSIVLSEVMPDVPPELSNRYQEWYDGLTRKQQLIVDRWEAALENAELGNTTVHYNLDKRPETPWTMNIGGQIEFNRNWQFRSEVNFLGERTSLLVNLVYRLDL